MNEATLFVATPIHGHALHVAYVAGCLKAISAFRDRIRVQTQIGSILPRNRDILTAQFIQSTATHMLCIDSDIGWTPDQAQALLDTGKDFVSGTYCKKQEDRDIPAAFTGRRQGPLFEATHVPGGFLLLSRACIERMIGAYHEMEYVAGAWGRIWALWAPLFEQGVTYSGEDVAFCNRWRKIGGEVWMHRGVVVEHYGEKMYAPEPYVDGKEERTTGLGIGEREALEKCFPGTQVKMYGRLPVVVHPEAP